MMSLMVLMVLINALQLAASALSLALTVCSALREDSR